MIKILHCLVFCSVIGCWHSTSAVAQQADGDRIDQSLSVISVRSREARIRAGHAVTLGWIGAGLGVVNTALLIALLISRSGSAPVGQSRLRGPQKRLIATVAQLREAVEIRSDENRHLKELLGAAEAQISFISREIGHPTGKETTSTTTTSGLTS